MTINASSPYTGVPAANWLSITDQLISEHPLSTDKIVEIVLSSWASIFDSSIGVHQFKIGKDIFPKPQIMGFFIHELIALEVAAQYPNEWRGEETSGDKDIVYLSNDVFSVEIKTSSNSKHIFGNRSYTQDSSKTKKSKSGYYLTVNFEPFSAVNSSPKILMIRFGWLDHDDWIGQKSSTGQQARLSPEAYKGKLKTLYSNGQKVL